MTCEPHTVGSDAGFRINGVRLALIKIGGMIALPAFVMGAQINASLGVKRALGASFCGGLLLAAVATAAGIVGARSRKSTYELIVDAFGEMGARWINGLLALSLIGWFGVVAALFGESLGSLLGGMWIRAVPLWSLLGATLVVVTIFWGFKALNHLSLVVTPLKIGLLLWVVTAALSEGMERVLQGGGESSLALGDGISLVAGGLFVGATLVPDICRYARNGWHAALATILSFGLCFPGVLALSGVAALASGERDLIRLMLVLGLGIPALVTVLLTAWQTNAANLYSSCLIARTVWPRRPWWQLVLGAGTLGMAVGVSGLSQDLTGFLTLLSLAIPPVAAIYLVHFVSTGWRPPRTCQWRWSALVAWGVSVAVAGGLRLGSVSLTGIPALDAFLCAALVYFGFRYVDRD